MDCIFCKIIQGVLPAFKVYEDDEVIAFMDRKPINLGHILVLPKEHRESIFDMEPQKVGKLYEKVAIIAKNVKEALKADGLNIGQNNGKAANQIIPHVHVHVIPRYLGDSPTGGWPSRKNADLKELKEVADKIRSYLTKSL
ncbi:MAG: HIT family protein [Nitrososphaerales archaeon]